MPNTTDQIDELQSPQITIHHHKFLKNEIYQNLKDFKLLVAQEIENKEKPDIFSIKINKLFQKLTNLINKTAQLKNISLFNLDHSQHELIEQLILTIQIFSTQIKQFYYLYHEQIENYQKVSEAVKDSEIYNLEINKETFHPPVIEKLLDVIDTDIIDQITSKCNDLIQFQKKMAWPLRIVNKSMLLWMIKILVTFYVKLTIRDLYTEITIIQRKWLVCCQFFPHALLYSKDDLLAKNQKTSEEWQKLSNAVTLVKLNNPKRFQRQLRMLKNFIYCASNFINNSIYEKTYLRKVFGFLWSASFYFFYTSRSIRNSRLLFSEPSYTLAQGVWHVPDSKYLKWLYKYLLFPRIATKIKLHIPKLYEPITLDKINKQLENNTLNTCSSLVDSLEPQQQQYNIFRKEKNTVSVRLMAPDYVEAVYKNSINMNPLKRFVMQQFQNIKNQFSNQAKTNQSQWDTVVIHMHGGGYIAMSSQSHQNYTRKFANILNAPVFSIDYSLTPFGCYPYSLDECWQVYNWILNSLEKELNIKPKKIILTGDSAGGNLAMALTLLCIKNKVRVPNGLLLAYTPFLLNLKQFSPCFFNVLQDDIVPYGFLKLCLGLYTQNAQNQLDKDPLISPLLASDELLKQLPPIRVILGDVDPSYDDTLRLTSKLQNVNKDIKVSVFEQFPHGFLNYDAPHGMSECARATDIACQLMKDMAKS